MKLRATRSIRFRISTLLLLTTLNAMALVLLSGLLFGVVLEGPSRGLVNRVREVSGHLSALHDRVVAAALPGHAEAPGALSNEVDHLYAELDALGPDAEEAREELEDYRVAVRAWEDHVASGHVDGDNLDAGHLAAVRMAHRRLNGQLNLMITYQRPRWVDAVKPWLPFGLAIEIFFTILVVMLAFGLRLLISRPLQALADAAEAIGDGEVEAEVPGVDEGTEIAVVARAMAAMRDRLVESIREIDATGRETATILANMSDGVLLADPSGRVVKANPQAQALLAVLAAGRPARDETPLVDLIPELDDPDLADKTGFELTVHRTKPRSRWIELRVRELAGRDEDARVFVLRDVTGDHEMEQMKREFLSVVTHELKTPLTSIEGYAKLLALNKGGELSEKQRFFVRTIQEQAGVLKEMIQNLLDASRLEGGNLTIQAEPLLVTDVATAIGDTWRGTVDAKGIRFHMEVAPTTGRFLVDSFRMGQVLGNLIGNACKFTPAGGRISLSAAVVGDTVVLSVTDSGRGIPAEALPHIFEKFYQVERGDTRVAGGAGLGLYIVRLLVEAQGGRIAVDSRVGEGTRFDIRFPVHRSPP